MRFTKFTIKNYKGIDKIVFDLQQTPESTIYTLVGLNESGKTTILEALWYFDRIITKKDEIVLESSADIAPHTIIPKKLKHNFNGKTEIIGEIALDDNDINYLKELLKSKGYIVNKFQSTVTGTVAIEFENSKHKNTKRLYTFHLAGKENASQKKDKTFPINHPARILTANWLDQHSQPIIYYPNFLFEFPDRIYLEKVKGDLYSSNKQAFYKQFLQDILDSIGGGLNLENHILARAKSAQPEDKESLEETLNRMSERISKLVLESDFSVFPSSTGKKSIVITQPYLDIEKNAYYVELKYKDGTNSFYIRERSLGFRWFFTFLLLTQFRVARQTGKIPLFLFDEPASNLHSSAQQKVLDALEELTNKSQATVVYSTHSHHLISPRRLETTFIVKNKATDKENEDISSDYITDVSIERYRSFVGKYPDQRSYFQPILDVLEYRPSNLENVPNVIMVEGKNDFYTLEYFSKVYFKDETLPMLPGGGSGTLDTAIQLYYAWGRNFIILLDDDEAGKKERKRYLEKFGSIVQGRIITYKDIDNSLSGFRAEGIFEDDDKLLLSKITEPASIKPNKKLINIALQELLMNNTIVKFSEEAENRAKLILEHLKKQLNCL